MKLLGAILAFYIIMEFVMFCIFVGFGGFPGFVIWVLVVHATSLGVVLSCACYYINRLVVVKEEQLQLQIRKQEQEENK